eukprot:TRINITY_DN1371_c3_g3_i1.p2 TRINITY_DN1371_c3_g3~~TRINITY_DN1371_c3_g3_i1.p2  ORF type:complete len:205 (-),score=63.19 TRINITY_DN1371_c3_g3_i1:381-995(-)
MFPTAIAVAGHLLAGHLRLQPRSALQAAVAAVNVHSDVAAPLHVRPAHQQHPAGTLNAHISVCAHVAAGVAAAANAAAAAPPPPLPPQQQQWRQRWRRRCCCGVGGGGDARCYMCANADVRIERAGRVLLMRWAHVERCCDIAMNIDCRNCCLQSAPWLQPQMASKQMASNGNGSREHQTRRREQENRSEAVDVPDTSIADLSC